MIILSHPTGNRNVRAVLSSLAEAGMLAKFNTTIAADSKSFWLKLLPQRFRQEWLRRVYPVPPERIVTRPFLEVARMALSKMRFGGCVHHEHGWASIDSVYKDLDVSTARNLEKMLNGQKVTAVYAYEDGALSTFTRAKELGLKCIYELPIAFWETVRKLMREEAERLPGWALTLRGGIQDSPAKLERKTCELELADVVIAPGSFVIDSLPRWARDKNIIMSPFGSPGIGGYVRCQPEVHGKQVARPLRVLFAGSMGQRKGLGDLFAAMRLLNSPEIELVVMGSMLAPASFYRSELPGFKYEPPRPHEQVLTLMRSCDIFCLPSIVEGRALVMQEAMSNGLPLIITSNTGGEDLIKEGCTGFLVPIRSPESIADKLAWFLDHRSQIPQMAQMAREHAAQYSWEMYGSTIVRALSDAR